MKRLEKLSRVLFPLTRNTNKYTAQVFRKLKVVVEISVAGTFPRARGLFRSKFLFPARKFSASGIYIISPLLLLSTPPGVL